MQCVSVLGAEVDLIVKTVKRETSELAFYRCYSNTRSPWPSSSKSPDSGGLPVTTSSNQLKTRERNDLRLEY